MSQHLHPWETWKLDTKFIADLNDWATQNPNHSLTTVLEGICDAIEKGREFFELIPNGPFPARGLVKGLAHLVEFGKTFAAAKAEVHDFAMEVVEWVSNLQRAFSGRKNWMTGHFTRTAWRNLERIRKIIDEICQWAAARLSDKRWSLVATWNKLRVQEVIKTFKERIADARAIFNESAVVHQSRGIDAILHMIGILNHRQREFRKKLEGIQATQTSQLNGIIASLDSVKATQTARDRRQFVEQTLSKHVVQDPTYTGQGKFPCDRDTRAGVLAAIARWVRNVAPGSQNFFWLSGNPGCGKSAITASLARQSKIEDILWAQLFINRNNPETTNPNMYFPTIALQLSKRSADVERKVYDQLSDKEKRTLLDEVSSEQAASFFIDTAHVASRLDPSKPVVIVIDGLDETDKRYLRSVAVIFARLFNALLACPNVKVFISSRTDNDIQTPFANAILGSACVRKLHLYTNHRSSIADVTRYLRKRLTDIVSDHNLEWDEWPGDQGFDLLAKHASGLFIWAATAVKFFQQQIEDWGRERLIFLLDDLNSKGMIDINALYGFIIINTYRNQVNADVESEWAYETFRRLVGAIVVLYEPLSLDNLGRILNLRQTPSSPPVDVIQFAKRLRTVLVAGAGSIHGGTIPQLHKSFYEFITSDRVDGHFRIQTNRSHHELGIQCLRQLVHFKTAISRFKMPVVYRYACRFWSQHLVQGPGLQPSGILIAKSAGFHGIREVGNLLQYSSSKLAKTVSLTVSASSVAVSVSGKSCSWDTEYGFVEGGVKLDLVQCGLFDYIPNSPPIIGTLDEKYITTVYQSRSIRPRLIDLWDTETMLKSATFKTFNEGPGSNFHNGHFAEAGPDTIRIWTLLKTRMDCKYILSFANEEGSPTVSCLALSSKGDFLAVGRFDGSLHFWNVSGNPTFLNFSSNTAKDFSAVTAIVFSIDGTKLLSCSAKETTIVLWALVRGGFHQFLFLNVGGTSVPLSIVFSPDARTAVSGHANGTICIWDVANGDLIGSFLQDDTSRIQSCITLLQFSDDGDSIISGSGGILDIWDVETRWHITSLPVTKGPRNGFSACFLPRDQICIATPSGATIFGIRGKHTDLIQDNSRYPELLCFSLNKSYTISTSLNGKLCLKDTSRKGQEGIMLETNTSFSPCTCAISRDETTVAMSSSNGTIYLWDVRTGKKIASSHFGAISSQLTLRGIDEDSTSMFFTSDNTLVTVSGGKTLLWEAKNGKLTRLPSHWPLATSPPFFDDDDYDLDDARSHYNTQWIPCKYADRGLWAFIDDHVIRVHQDGSLVIAQITSAKKN